jgi:hypothetical protein
MDRDFDYDYDEDCYGYGYRSKTQIWNGGQELLDYSSDEDSQEDSDEDCSSAVSDNETSNLKSFASWRHGPKMKMSANLEQHLRELEASHAEYVAKGKAIEYWLMRELKDGVQVSAGNIEREFQLHSKDYIDFQRRNCRHPEDPDIATESLEFSRRYGKVTAGFDLEGYLKFPRYRAEQSWSFSCRSKDLAQAGTGSTTIWLDTRKATFMEAKLCMLGNRHVKISISEDNLGGSTRKDIVFYGVAWDEDMEEDDMEKEWKKTDAGWTYQGPGGKKPHEEDHDSYDSHEAEIGKGLPTPVFMNEADQYKYELDNELKVRAVEKNLAEILSKGEQVALGSVRGEWKLYSTDYNSLYGQTQSSINYHPDRPYSLDWSGWHTGTLRLGKHFSSSRITAIQMVGTDVGAQCEITGFGNLWHFPYSTPEKASTEPQSNYAFGQDGIWIKTCLTFFGDGYLGLKIPAPVFGESEDYYPDGYFYFYGIFEQAEEEVEEEWRLRAGEL